MKIAHVSDTHGLLEPIRGDAEVIVHSGDFLPNRTRGLRVSEETTQPAWVAYNEARIRKWVDHRTFVLCRGNHDYVDPIPMMREMGIDAYGIDDRMLHLDGISFYGFPWVPYFSGEWNHEVSPRELTARLDAAEPLIAACDILVAHCPIYGVLDMTQEGERAGSKPMRKLLQRAERVPNLYLCGHIHEQGGALQRWSRDIDVSNAACSQRILDYRPR